MRLSRSPTVCSYSDFRTGLTYRDVYQMLWSASRDPRDWRYKRRGTVLGMWRQIKREMYNRYLGEIREL